MVGSFVLFLTAFLAIGAASVIQSRGTRQDYYVAGRSMPPWLVGLSAVATNNSGYMFIGVIGYTYLTGLASVWLMCGWILGDFLASLYIHRPLRLAAQRSTEVSYAGVIGHWNGQRFKAVQRFIALVSLAFMLTYASAQLLAGGKALHVLFDWPLWAGAVLGCLIIAIYCFAGGIRASIWTDAAQSAVMLVAMGLLLLSGVETLGGIDAVVTRMETVDGYLDWFPGDLLLPGVPGALLFSIGWLFAGLSVIGQPHIMIRFLTLEDPSSFTTVRIWYYGWFAAFYAMATAVGMLSRIYLSDPGSFDAELALPMMAFDLLPAPLVGLVLAGIIAATMSTADSLVLGCSASITHDLVPHRMEHPLLLKLVTLLVALTALGLAVSGSGSVFDLVVMSWSVMASSFGPLLILYVLGVPVTERGALITMAAGLATAVAWRELGWHETLYEGMPGILTGLTVGWLLREKARKGDARKGDGGIKN